MKVNVGGEGFKAVLRFHIYFLFQGEKGNEGASNGYAPIQRVFPFRSASKCINPVHELSCRKAEGAHGHLLLKGNARNSQCLCRQQELRP